MMMYKQLPKEQRLEIQELHKKGLSVNEIAKKIPCTRKAVYRWRKRLTTDKKIRKKDNYKKRWKNSHGNDELILQLYKETPSSRKVRKKLLVRGIKLSIVTILKRIPDHLKCK